MFGSIIFFKENFMDTKESSAPVNKNLPVAEPINERVELITNYPKRLQIYLRDVLDFAHELHPNFRYEIVPVEYLVIEKKEAAETPYKYWHDEDSWPEATTTVESVKFEVRNGLCRVAQKFDFGEEVRDPAEILQKYLTPEKLAMLRAAGLDEAAIQDLQIKLAEHLHRLIQEQKEKIQKWWQAIADSPEAKHFSVAAKKILRKHYDATSDDVKALIAEWQVLHQNKPELDAGEVLIDFGGKDRFGGTESRRYWVITPAGELRPADQIFKSRRSELTTIWSRVEPAELALGWYKDYAAADHEFYICKWPVQGVTPEQAVVVKQIQQTIVDEFKASDEYLIQRGRIAPNVGSGWKIKAGDKKVENFEENYLSTMRDMPAHTYKVGSLSVPPTPAKAKAEVVEPIVRRRTPVVIADEVAGAPVNEQAWIDSGRIEREAQRAKNRPPERVYHTEEIAAEEKIQIEKELDLLVDWLEQIKRVLQQAEKNKLAVGPLNKRRENLVISLQAIRTGLEKTPPAPALRGKLEDGQRLVRGLLDDSGKLLGFPAGASERFGLAEQQANGEIETIGGFTAENLEALRKILMRMAHEGEVNVEDAIVEAIG